MSDEELSILIKRCFLKFRHSLSKTSSWDACWELLEEQLLSEIKEYLNSEVSLEKEKVQ